jgi:hypothetical protein
MVVKAVRDFPLLRCLAVLGQLNLVLLGGSTLFTPPVADIDSKIPEWKFRVYQRYKAKLH